MSKQVSSDADANDATELIKVAGHDMPAPAKRTAARETLTDQTPAKLEQLAGRVTALEGQVKQRIDAIEQTLAGLTVQMNDVVAAGQRYAAAISDVESAEARLANSVNDLSSRFDAFLGQPHGILAIPGILLSTMPKSASVYIMRTLADSLGIEFMPENVAHGFFPNYFLIPNRLHRLDQGNVVRHEHFDASAINVELLVRRDQRLVLHLRDPRQATLSWAHHLNRITATHADPVNYTVNTPPADYASWPFETQLDWHIETHLRSMEQWLRGWINHTGSGSPLKVLVTRYEELVADEQAFFQRIIDFFDIPHERFELRPARRTVANNFRKGNCDEWKHVFSDAQKARAIEVLGADVLAHFGWET